MPKVEARRWSWATRRALVASSLACLVPAFFVYDQRRRVLAPGVATNPSSSPRELTPMPAFDCAVSWIRMPKTASTSTQELFIKPLVGGFFTTTTMDPNTCVAGVGDCADLWGGLGWDPGPRTKSKAKAKKIKGWNLGSPAAGASRGEDGDSGPLVPAPPFGGADSGTGNNQRCFPVEGGERPRCLEYDARTSSLNFGPHDANAFVREPKKGGRPTIWTEKFDSTPGIARHVGLDPSLFGWILPPRPMVFSAFRDPLDRLLSSFHFGLRNGAGRPGEVAWCDLPGGKRGQGFNALRGYKSWQEGVVRAREAATLNGDTAEYQRLLREYLGACGNAADNAYVQFLDPAGKDVDVALGNLERYIIVGLQDEMEESLRRWANITLWNCRDHPQIRQMENALKVKMANPTGAQRRKSVATIEVNIENATKGEDDEDSAQPKNNSKEKKSSVVSLVTPDVESFDEDLQELVKKFIAGDEVIYNRVLELYEEQRHWGFVRHNDATNLMSTNDLTEK